MVGGFVIRHVGSFVGSFIMLEFLGKYKSDNLVIVFTSIVNACHCSATAVISTLYYVLKTTIVCTFCNIVLWQIFHCIVSNYPQVMWTNCNKHCGLFSTSLCRFRNITVANCPPVMWTNCNNHCGLLYTSLWSY